MMLGEVADEALLASARVVPSRLTSAGFKFEHSTVGDALAAALGSGR
jgi:NAD dependent epimerase/dehydratase family enzyme